MSLKEMIATARGKAPADLVINENRQWSWEVRHES